MELGLQGASVLIGHQGTVMSAGQGQTHTPLITDVVGLDLVQPLYVVR